MERSGGIDPKCKLHIPSDFCPVKTIAVAGLSSSRNDLNKHQIPECRTKDTNSDILKSADSKEAVKASDISSSQGEQMLQLVDSSELDFADTVNARKSLAWDSAFFDSAGILDEEELFNMIDGVCRSRQNCMPAAIKKNVHRTYDTISSLERIEAELFTDIRASTQTLVKEPNLGNLSGKTAVENRGNKVTISSKKTDTISKDRPKSILKKESEGSQQTKKLGSRLVPTVQAATSILRTPITTGRSISTQSKSVSTANLSRVDPKKSKDTGKLGVSTKPVLISRSNSVSSSPLIKKTGTAAGNVTNSIDAGRKVSSTAVNQPRTSSNVITKRHIDLKSYMMLTKLSPTKSSASSLSDTSSESYLTTPSLNNKNNRRSNESSKCNAATSPRSQSKVGRSLNFMSKSNDRLLGSVRSLTKAMTNQDLKKGEPNRAKSVNTSSSNSVGARVSSVNKGSSMQITKGRVGTGAIKGSDSRWM